MSKENVELTKQAYAAFRQGDIPKVLTYWSPEIEWTMPKGNAAQGGVHRGADAIVKEVFQSIPNIWDDFILTTQEFIDAGDRVFVLGETRSKGKETGETMTSPFIHTVEYRDGKITRFQDYSDTAISNAAAGIQYRSS